MMDAATLMDRPQPLFVDTALWCGTWRCHRQRLSLCCLAQGGFSAATDLLAAAGLLPARLEPRASLALGSVLLIRSRATASPSAPSSPPSLHRAMPRSSIFL
jgi:hypothetical protein